VARPEDILQKAVCDYLDRCLPSACYWCAIPNGAVLAGGKKERGMQMNKLKATGLKPGAPDLFVIYNGRFIGIELKSSSGRTNDNQKRASDQITVAGGLYSICRSVDEVESFLRMVGLPMFGRLAA